MLVVILSFLFNLFSQPLHADSRAVPLAPPALSVLPADTIRQDSLYIRNVQIECHQKTIDRIILREMALKPGDRVSKHNLRDVLEKESSKIFNTNLFVVAEVFDVPAGRDSIDLVVSVVEKWYLYPVPIVDLADRPVIFDGQEDGFDLVADVDGV